MSFSIERSQSPHKNGLAQMFSKSRKDKKGRDSAGNSVKSSSGSDGRGVRSSLEDLDKLKTHSSNVTEDGADSNGIKKLVPKVLGSKRRRKKQEREEEQIASEEAARGRTVAERGTLENDPSPHARSSGEGDGSSIITYDSETES